MAPVDGLIAVKIYTNQPLMPDNNISKGQPSKSKGLGAVGGQRSKNAATLKRYIDLTNSACVDLRVLCFRPRHGISIAISFFDKLEDVWCYIHTGCSNFFSIYP